MPFRRGSVSIMTLKAKQVAFVGPNLGIELVNQTIVSRDHYYSNHK
jgi:hypothetical protein